MKKTSVPHCVLYLHLLVSITAATVGFTSVPARLHAAVTLPCKQKCSTAAKWIRTLEDHDVLAQCDQTSCQTKTDFQMSYINYLNGDLGLTISKVDYSKRTFYTCRCGDADICNVRLSIVALKSTLLKKAGEPLVLRSAVPEPVEVVFKNSNSSDLYGVPICTVVRRSLQCHTNYSKRTTANQTDVTLQSLQGSDSGVYTVRDMKNDEDIHIYTVSVEETVFKEDELGQFVVMILIVLLVLGTFSCILIMIIRDRQQKKKIKQLQNSLQKEKEKQNQIRSHSDTDITELCRRMAHVDELIQRSEDTFRGYKTWTISGMTNTEEQMRNIRAKMEELLQPRNGTSSELFDHKWWSQKRIKLDQILEQWKEERAELEDFRLKLRDNRTKGLMGSSDDQTIYFKRGPLYVSSINEAEKTLEIPNGIQPWRTESAEPEEIRKLYEGAADEQTPGAELSEETEEFQSISNRPSEPETQN